MKSIKNLLEIIKPLSHFSKDTVYQLGRQLGLKDATIDTYISRFLKNKELLRLKNGLYISADFLRKQKGDISYLFYLANVLRTPSYVSSWAALQYYNLATERVHDITSVTTRVTRTYNTKVGAFVYQSMKQELFSDFYLAKGAFDFYVASPAKALFDLLYFRTHQFRGIQLGGIKILIDELRIDMDEINEEEQAKFYTLLKTHLHHE